MLIALDSFGFRISPRKGLTGKCQICGNPVKAYCGNIIIHHWKHVAELNCDPWKEHESEWHRSWKNEFPKDWQEVIMNKGNNKHIADVKTKNGLVLELQNSSISSSTIEEREDFYGNIIWLINAKPFQDNFMHFSIVKSKLLELERSKYSSLSYYQKEDSKIIKDLKEKIEDCKSDYTNLSYEVPSLERLRTEIIELNSNIEKTLISYLTQKYLFSRILNEFSCKEKEAILSIRSQKELINTEIQECKKTLQKIESFPGSEVPGFEHYKIIPHTAVSSSSFSKCRLVEKETKDSLFPFTLPFHSKEEFEQISSNKNYILIIDLNEVLENIHQTINSLSLELKQLEKAENNNLRYMEVQLTDFLEVELKKCLSKLKIRKDKIKQVNQSIDSLQNEIKWQKENEEDERELEITQQEEMHELEKNEIMTRFKGQFYYQWKHRRQSWNYAKARIFVDFKSHISELVSDTTLRKLSKTDFVHLIKNWK
ncbi:hypothetical protein [Algoriphagus chordae]|uniref:Competence protein CoiA-like protein n=1 Tax=Algoriphagus chordae TaxID=237019 RepID=A0A2W7RQP8_9BACT|nr:hypothetical protein [Algoriphagus chordae]PZX56809.1 hypothetical protein LV85_00742 [Algoriphagus chordae]